MTMKWSPRKSLAPGSLPPGMYQRFHAATEEIRTPVPQCLTATDLLELLEAKCSQQGATKGMSAKEAFNVLARACANLQLANGTRVPYVPHLREFFEELADGIEEELT